MPDSYPPEFDGISGSALQDPQDCYVDPASPVMRPEDHYPVETLAPEGPEDFYPRFITEPRIFCETLMEVHHSFAT